MRPIKLLLTIVLLLHSASIFACYPAKVALENRVENADVIDIGVVVNVFAPHKKTDQVGVVSSSINLPQAYSLNVMVDHVIKGKDNNKNITVDVLNCGAGGAKLNDKVIVFNSKGYWYTKIFTQQVNGDLLRLTQ